MAGRVYLRYVEDDTIGCGCMVNAGLDCRNEQARGVWVGLFRDEDEDVLDI